VLFVYDEFVCVCMSCVCVCVVCVSVCVGVNFVCGVFMYYYYLLLWNV